MKRKALMAACMGVLLLAGCTGKVNFSKTTQSTVGINLDGSIEEVIVESFDKDYYSLDELTSYISDQVNIFNEANPQEQPEISKYPTAGVAPVTAVAVGDIKMDEVNKVVHANLKYLNTDLYNAFNHTDIQILTLDEAKADESIAATEHMLRVNNGNPINFSDIASEESLYVLVTESPLCIQMAATPLYYTDTASVVDSHTIQTAAEGRTVIVFKK